MNSEDLTKANVTVEKIKDVKKRLDNIEKVKKIGRGPTLIQKQDIHYNWFKAVLDTNVFNMALTLQETFEKEKLAALEKEFAEL